MQTFAPAPLPYQVAQLLDYRRLGKQRIETKQILMALLGVDKAGDPTSASASVHTRNHPITAAWRGHDWALWEYGWAMCEEWRVRGYKSTVHTWYDKVIPLLHGATMGFPWWWGTNKIIENHQRMLHWKQPEHYATIWPTVAATANRFAPGYWYPGQAPGDWTWKEWAHGD